VRRWALVEDKSIGRCLSLEKSVNTLTPAALRLYFRHDSFVR
jgi:hypothetical protein